MANEQDKDNDMQENKKDKSRKSAILTGVSAGGRTGYTAITTGALFLVAMFFSPIFVAIPSCATAPALIYVGYLMLSTVKDIEFNNITEGVPAFLTTLCVRSMFSHLRF